MNDRLPSLIFITGFMGCGKTTIGRELAALMKRSFTDTDELVHKISGKPVEEIFERDGEPAFRKLESRALHMIVKGGGRQVVALGGGAICNKKNLALVLKNGYMVYIQLPAALLAARLGADFTGRPILRGLKEEGLQDFIEKKLEERRHFYERAQLMVSGINLGADSLYQIISAASPRENT